MKRMILIVLFSILMIPPSLGGIIYLKDGSLVETDKVWEQDGYIHFILKGTRRVEIRYAREIVDHILGDDGKRIILTTSASSKKTRKLRSSDSAGAQTPSKNVSAMKSSASSTSAETPTTHAKNPRPSVAAQKQKTDVTPDHGPKTESKLTGKMLAEYEAQLDKLKGVGFYYPLRPKKYWTNLTSRYDTLTEAIAALAQQYGRPRAWVIANMGKVNDLCVIHKNLIESIRKNMDSPVRGSSEDRFKRTSSSKVSG